MKSAEFSNQIFGRFVLARQLFPDQTDNEFLHICLFYPISLPCTRGLKARVVQGLISPIIAPKIPYIKSGIDYLSLTIYDDLGLSIQR